MLSRAALSIYSAVGIFSILFATGHVNANVCTSNGCKRESKLIHDSFDETVSPCEDFYKFACGKFVKNAHIPDGKPYYSPDVQLVEEVLDQISTVLNGTSSKNEAKPFTLAKTLYETCMDKKTLEEKGMDFLLL